MHCISPKAAIDNKHRINLADWSLALCCVRGHTMPRTVLLKHTQNLPAFYCPATERPYLCSNPGWCLRWALRPRSMEHLSAASSSSKQHIFGQSDDDDVDYQPHGNQ